MDNPLAQLKDIHLPEPVTWWPPTPLAIITVCLIFLMIGLVIFFVIKRFENNAAKREALSLLKNIEQQKLSDKAYLNEIAILIRRYCIAKNSSTKSLEGKNWQYFLSQYMDEKDANLIASYRYQKDAVVNRASLKNSAENLLKGLIA